MDMNGRIRKILSVLAGAVLALLFAIPYVVFRSQIREFAALGYLGLFAACALSNATLFIPTSSTAFVILAATSLNPWLCVLFGSMGTALGEQASYLCGAAGGKGFEEKGYSAARFVAWMQRNEFLTVFLAAFVPLPVFDIIGVAAGARKMRWWKFALAAVLGKVIKYILAIGVVRWFLPFCASILPDEGGPLMRWLMEMLAIKVK